MPHGRIIISTLLLCTTTLSAVTTETWEAFSARTQKPPISFQENALQVYFLKRISRAADLLAYLHKKRIFPALCAQQSKEGCLLFDANLIFTCETIISCRNTIGHKKSLQPFLVVWDSIKKGGPGVNVTFLREFSILILEIYKIIFTGCSPLVQIAFQKGLVLQAIAMLGGNMSTLHAFEILSLIDKLTEKIPTLLEQYEITNKELSWKQWFTKYWWLPPVAAGAVIFETVFLYQVAIGQQKLPNLKRAIKSITERK